MRLFRGSSGLGGRFPAGLGLLLLVIAVCYRGVWCGRVFFFEDVAAYFGPLWAEVVRQLRLGHLPNYSEGAWAGQPLLGDPQIGVFYPLHWLWLLCDPLRAYAISVPLHAAVAGTGVYLAARDAGRSALAATSAAVALALSAFYVLEARHVMFLASAAWVPWILWSMQRALRGGALRDFAGVSAFSALALLGGGWSMLLFALPPLVTAAALLLARCRRPAPRLLALAGAAVGALGLAAIQLLPAMAHATLAPRALPLGAAFASSFSWPSLGYAVSLILPLWFGDDARGTYVGAGDQWELCGYGLGAIAALAAALGLVDSMRRRRAGPLAQLALVAVAAVLALGDRGPLWGLWRTLPLLSQVRCPARALFIYTVVAPGLCALGVDALAGRVRARCGRRAGRALWLIPVLIAIELSITFRAENPTVPLAATDLTPEVVRDALPSAERTILDVHLGQAFHNGGLRWGFPSTSGYSSLPLWRPLHLCWIANHGAVYPGWPHPQLDRDLTAQGLWTFDSPIVDLLNARWLITDRMHPPAGAGWVRVAIGSDGIDRWRNDEALPIAFVVHRLAIAANEADAARRIARADFSPASEVVVESAQEGSGAMMIPARSVRRTPGELDVGARAQGAGILVVSIPWEPSWVATLDGAPAPVLRVDYALLGVALPSGEHHVHLSRIDRPLVRGITVSTLALLLLVAVLASGGGRRRVPS